jgi:zinc transporter ZupT
MKNKVGDQIWRSQWEHCQKNFMHGPQGKNHCGCSPLLSLVGICRTRSHVVGAPTLHDGSCITWKIKIDESGDAKCEAAVDISDRWRDKDRRGEPPRRDLAFPSPRYPSLSGDRPGYRVRTKVETCRSSCVIDQTRCRIQCDKATAAIVKKEEPNPSVKLSAYLNIIADFTHNITDGLAMSSSFYASPTIGATTTLAVFCHEIPHEVGDFALLIQGGMSKRTAMALQFVTALGAVLGTIIGIAVQELGGNPASVVGAVGGNSGLWGTSLQWGDMLLPFTAGTFLYVGTVGVVPEMLETGPDRMKELRSMALQFAAMAAGAGIMLG